MITPQSRDHADSNNWLQRTATMQITPWVKQPENLHSPPASVEQPGETLRQALQGQLGYLYYTK
jgi:hypothetical protein